MSLKIENSADLRRIVEQLDEKEIVRRFDRLLDATGRRNEFALKSDVAADESA